jgi:hypothetical protein
MALRFSYDHKGTTGFGSGTTQDLSRSGVRFLSDLPLPDGAEVHLRIAWPFLLQNVCPLELVVSGSIVRTGPRGTIVRMREYEFKTCGERSFASATASLNAYGVLG